MSSWALSGVISRSVTKLKRLKEHHLLVSGVHLQVLEEVDLQLVLAGLVEGHGVDVLQIGNRLSRINKIIQRVSLNHKPEWL